MKYCLKHRVFFSCLLLPPPFLFSFLSLWPSCTKLRPIGSPNSSTYFPNLRTTRPRSPIGWMTGVRLVSIPRRGFLISDWRPRRFWLESHPLIPQYQLLNQWRTDISKLSNDKWYVFQKLAEYSIHHSGTTHSTNKKTVAVFGFGSFLWVIRRIFSRTSQTPTLLRSFIKPFVEGLQDLGGDPQKFRKNLYLDQKLFRMYFFPN